MSSVRSTSSSLLSPLLTLMVVLASLVVAHPSTAQDSPVEDLPTELKADVDTTIVVDPRAGTVSATHSYRFANDTLDETFNAVVETLPADADEIVAQAGRNELAVTRGPQSDGRVQILVGFPTPLQPGDTLDVVISWVRRDLDGDPNDLAFLSPALVAIEVFGVGHGGGVSTLEVEAPAGYVVVESSSLTVAEDDTTLRLSTDAVEPYRSGSLVLSAPGRLVELPVAGIDLDVTVAALAPGDRGLASTIAAVAAVLGRWLPVDLPPPIGFREGWTGSSDARSVAVDSELVPLAGSGAERTVVVVSPEVPPAVVAREIAAVWITSIPFEDPVLEDGMARALGNAAAVEIGDAPAPAVETEVESPWLPVLSTVLNELDDDTTAAVVAALAGGSISYRGAAPTERDGAIDWRIVLDVFENVGGSTSASSLFRRVVDADDQLDLREEARRDYADLQARADDWTLPPWLRIPLAEWDFDSFFGREDAVATVLARRDSLRREAEEIDLQVGSFLRERFEMAGDGMAAAETLLDDQEEAVELIAEARQAVVGDRGLLAGIGLIGSDTDEEYRQIVDAWNDGEFVVAGNDSSELIEEIEGALGKGTLRLVVPTVLILALAALLRIVVRGFARRRTDAGLNSAESPGEAEVLDESDHRTDQHPAS